MSFDAYLKLVEDLFCGGERLDPQTDGRPDPRPVVREEVSILGDLLEEFDFSQKSLDPLVLPSLARTRVDPGRVTHPVSEQPSSAPESTRPPTSDST